MKILLCIILFSACGLAGFYYKRRLQNQCDFFDFIEDFQNFYNSNMTLFKNNVVEITGNFQKLQKPKNVKFNQLFVIKNNILEIDESILKKYVLDESAVSVIKNYLSGLGKNDYEFEKEKNKNFELYLKSVSEKAKQNCEQKGGLYFKLSLALGALICIIIW